MNWVIEATSNLLTCPSYFPISKILKHKEHISKINFKMVSSCSKLERWFRPRNMFSKMVLHLVHPWEAQLPVFSLLQPWSSLGHQDGNGNSVRLLTLRTAVVLGQWNAPTAQDAQPGSCSLRTAMAALQNVQTFPLQGLLSGVPFMPFRDQLPQSRGLAWWSWIPDSESWSHSIPNPSG